MRSPWPLSLLVALGVTLLVPSGFALVAPPELLSAAASLGDRVLVALVVGLFVITAVVARLVIRRRDPADFVEAAPRPPPKRDEPEERSYLR